jgi:hypothetical protein
VIADTRDRLLAKAGDAATVGELFAATRPDPNGPGLMVFAPNGELATVNDDARAPPIPRDRALARLPRLLPPQCGWRPRRHLDGGIERVAV